MSRFLPILFGGRSSSVEDPLEESGMIELSVDIPLDAILSSIDDTEPLKYQQLSSTSLTSLVCLVVVPSIMIPVDLLHYFGSYRSKILSIRIFRHYSAQDKYLAIFSLDNQESASQLMKDYVGTLLTSLEPTYCYMYPVCRVSFKGPILTLTDRLLSLQPSAQTPDPSLSSSPSSPSVLTGVTMSSLGFARSPTALLSPRLRSLSLSREVSATSSPTPVAVTPAAAAATGDISVSEELSMSDSGGADVEPEYCAVCLDLLDELRPCTFTTCCNHTFHMECISRLEGPQCPVCRFEHDGLSVETSECVSCAELNLHSSDSLLEPPPDPDMWVCLVCGFVGCGAREHDHIRRHYLSSLHAYAMNTHTRHVWDFAGGGFVHRLILNMPGEGSEDDRTRSEAGAGAGAGAGRGIKLVEVSDPTAVSTERPLRAPLTTEEEEILISRKLESAAYQFNQLLSWQLEQQRAQYEAKIRRLRRSMVEDTAMLVLNAGKTGNDKEADRKEGKTSVPWAHSILAQIEQEKGKLMRQVESAKVRLCRAEEELDLLMELNRSLTGNVRQWQTRVDSAKLKFRESEASFSDWIPKLERKVLDLMQRLDSSSSSSQCASEGDV